jgi:hypothetical protein
LTDYFGAVSHVTPTHGAYQLVDATRELDEEEEEEERTNKAVRQVQAQAQARPILAIKAAPDAVTSNRALAWTAGIGGAVMLSAILFDMYASSNDVAT